MSLNPFGGHPPGLVVSVLILFTVSFWAFYEQMGSSLVLLLLSPFLKKLMHLDKSIGPEGYAGGVVEPE